MGDLAGKHGVSADGQAWHFQACALLSQFSVAACLCNEELTKDQLKRIAPHASDINIASYIDPINQMLVRFGIDNVLVEPMYLLR